MLQLPDWFQSSRHNFAQPGVLVLQLIADLAELGQRTLDGRKRGFERARKARSDLDADQKLVRHLFYLLLCCKHV